MEKFKEGMSSSYYKLLVKNQLAIPFTLPHYIFEALLSWHFVLDEPKGTWIDVNTLPKNPYE